MLPLVSRAIPTRVGKSVRGLNAPSCLSGHPHAGGEILAFMAMSCAWRGPSPRGWGNHPAQNTAPTRKPGHPHAGGEIRSSIAGNDVRAGPSPRGWGNLQESIRNCGEQRAIPTRVGKSERGGCKPSLPPGHPHAGGEISRQMTDQARPCGPSPRGWGNPFRHLGHRPGNRAIPTRVGKSICRLPLPPASPGHPHAGGEIPLCFPNDFRHRGPSPRGWGNPGGAVAWFNGRRAIPTRVGKSPTCGPMWRRSAGHPHAGGEISPKHFAICSNSGPSPRGWGNRKTNARRAKCHRAIPTRVGKSHGRVRHCAIATGHPHAGGEIPTVACLNDAQAGPSPRGWGNPLTPRLHAERGRAIPTRVGKSFAVRELLPGSAGHPHAGGEISRPLAPHLCRRGPSPRGWGNPPAPTASPWRPRAIPTRVGKSRRAAR